jgi:glycoside/pentoside/hexuronide:cation symporter, GPH family
MIANGLKIRTKIGYGFGELGSVLFWSSLSFLLINYLTDEVGLSAGLAGFALMIGKIWDAVSDPAVGILSDRTRSSLGRRRPWILFGALPLGIIYALLFRNPSISNEVLLFVWASLMYVLLCSAYTVVNIPYIALIPELARNYDERSNLNGYRSIFSILGTLLGAGAAIPLLNRFPDRTEGYAAVGIIFGLIIAISALIPFFAVREKPWKEPANKVSVFKSYQGALKNKPFILILLSFGLTTAGFSVVTAVLIYYFKYIFLDESLLTGAILSILGISLAFIPVTVFISRHWGKKQVYMTGLGFLSLSFVLLFFLGHKSSIQLVYLYLAIGGVGLSTHYVMPWSMLPDAVEYGAARTGVRQEGVYFGIWTFVSKIGTAFAGLIIGLVLSFTGYIANSVQNTEAILGIRMLAGPISVIFFLLSILVISRYPLDRKSCDKLNASGITE